MECEKPIILTDFMLLSMVEVRATRFCIAWFQAFCLGGNNLLTQETAKVLTEVILRKCLRNSSGCCGARGLEVCTHQKQR